jgi:hypothetical protein
MMQRKTQALLSFALMVLVVMCMAPGRCAQSAQGFFSGDPAPDVAGNWNVDYDDSFDVEFEIDGAVYSGTVAGTGGSMTFDHDGETYEFDIDCSRELIVCPSEVFPDRVTLEQRDFTDRPHQIYMTVNEAECTGEMVDPVEGEDCGGETGIDCDDLDQVCDGVMVTRNSARLGSISDPVPANPEVGSTPDYTLAISLGGGIAVSGTCAVIAAAQANADLEYSGTYDPDANSMTGTEMADGRIETTFAAGCFFVEAAGGVAVGALAGAQIRLTTGFTATKARF